MLYKCVTHWEGVNNDLDCFESVIADKTELYLDNASNNKEICLRNQKAVASFSKLYQRVWKKKHLSLKTKAQVYRTIVFPNLTYGCETWTWTRSQMSLLEGTQYRFLRTIAGKTWKDKVFINGSDQPAEPLQCQF